MFNKSTILAVVIGAPALLFAACSSSSNPSDGGGAGAGGTTGGAGTTGSGGTGGTSGPPTLGTQIDRIGRPAINTAISDPFDGDATMHGAKQDAYNVATPATGSTFEAAFEANLAILDSLDTVCGNQFAADKTKTDATRYKALADVLADDQLYIDTSSGTCTTYLGVEANATGIIPNTDCGGRTLSEDVIDESYSLLAIGATTGVGDGVAADDKASAQTATFPFLAPPN
ncbi:MAG TPA: DUF4331 family protein [Polyangia bacterium]|nr:DUF4331 family protein [Polyangia bacterium]